MAAATATDEFRWVRDLVETGTGRTKLTVQQIEPVEAGVEVIAELQYPDTLGETRLGYVKLYLPASLAAAGASPLPLVHVAGYELERPGGEARLKWGIIASTPHGEEPNPLVRGENLDVAILHRVRTLPCVDDARVTVLGGSAGGYMTLMLAAETFPLVAALPDVPPVNLGYNCSYIMANRAIAAAKPEGQELEDLPVLTAVIPLGQGAVEMLGSDFRASAWLNASPIGRWLEITCPTHIVVTTADMLVPVNQYGDDLVRPFPPTEFPEGFVTDMDALLPVPETRLKWLEVVPPEDLEVFVVPAPEAPRLTLADPPDPATAVLVTVPFSKTRRFSLVVIDEGPMEPWVGHFKYFLGLDKEAFNLWSAAQPIGPEQLTEAKVRRLMLRLAGREAHPQAVERDGVALVLNRMDFPEAEEADVRRGLKTFCRNEANAARFRELYEALPDELRVIPTAELPG